MLSANCSMLVSTEVVTWVLDRPIYLRNFFLGKPAAYNQLDLIRLDALDSFACLMLKA